MDILLLGDLTSVTHSLCEALAQDYRTVLYGNPDKSLRSIRGVRLYKYDEAQQESQLLKLFRTYSFDAVILFSPAMMKKPDWASENAWLHTVFDLCREFKIPRTVYITLDVMRLEPREPGAYADYEILLRNDTGRLVRFYERSLNLTLLRVPYIYDENDFRYPMFQLLQIAHDSSRLYFAYGPDTKIDFVSMRDFTVLLQRVLDSSPGGEYTVGSGRDHTLKELGDALMAQKEGLTVKYNDQTLGLRLPRLQQKSEDSLRKDFGWIAKDDAIEDMPRIYSEYKPPITDRPPTLLDRLKKVYDYINEHNIIKYISVTVLFVLSEILNQWIQSYADFSFIDVHLVYVMLMGTVYGLGCGVYAAVLVCMSTLFSYYVTGLDAQIIFYNMENWMPFIFYLAVGAILGYTRDTQDARIKYTKQERDVIEEKYIFMKTAYEDMLVTKTELKKQVLGSHESFGRIYDITRKIDKEIPSEIMSELLKAMEDVLENNSIAIYMIGKDKAYGRLIVCSAEISRDLTKSIKLANYSDIMDNLKDGEVWSNTKSLPTYPAYCASIYEEGEPVYLVFINSVKFEQMNTYYVNQIKVLCGLCQNAFMRSLKEDRGIHTERCIENTELLKPTYFAQILAARKEMRLEHMADYVLCRADMPATNPHQINDELTPNMRLSDIAGLDKEGRPYILFAQATHGDLPVIQNRYMKNGIALKEVGDGEFKA